jgi:tRNA A-37 threonylcarbamoyl transferase component Bud32
VSQREKFRERFIAFKKRFMTNVFKVHPKVAFRVLGSILIFFPWMAGSLISSLITLQRWKKADTCRAFMRRNALAFEDVDIDSLTITMLSGGVSNANARWTCRKTNGETVHYFAKVFVEAGSFWAKHLSIASPFPAIYGGKTHERFTIDMISRVQLEALGIPVPKLVAYDTVEKVMVTEFLEGITVDSILEAIDECEALEPNDEAAIRQCAICLAKVHKAGFSLIDTQPVNCIWVPAEQKVYFTDLEFCSQKDKRSWDVGFFLCYLAARLPEAILKTVRHLFLESYRQERQIELAEIDETSHELREYLPIFRAILDIRRFTPEELFEGWITT